MDKPLDQVLLERGMVSPYELRPAVEEEQRTGKSLWQVLLERGVLGGGELTVARAAQVGMEFVDVTAVNPAPDAVAAVPEDVARRRTVLPIRVENGSIVVALSEPRSSRDIDEIAEVTGRRVSASLAVRNDLQAALNRAYGRPASSLPPPGGPGQPPPGAALPSRPATPQVSSGYGAQPGAASVFSNEDFPMVEAPGTEQPLEYAEEEREPHLGEFLNAVIDLGGSDLHLTAGLPPMVRVHGDLRPVEGYRVLQSKDLQDMVYSMITQRQRETFEANLELDVSYSLPGKARFRVNVFQQRDAVGAVLRLIPFEIKSVEELGLPAATVEFARLRRGLVLVTGITGSGKSTTLAALIDHVNSTRHEHIMTVEDPIEF